MLSAERDAGHDAGHDAGMDAGRDAMRDAGRLQCRFSSMRVEKLMAGGRMSLTGWQYG